MTATHQPIGRVALRRARLLIGGAWVDGADTFPVIDKFTGAVIGHADRASREQVDAAVAAAHASFEPTRLDAYERYTILRRACDLIEAAARRARARRSPPKRASRSPTRRTK